MRGLFFLVLLGCLPTWALTNGIVADRKDLESVVFFSSIQYDAKTRTKMPGFCNGNLISSRVLVTAAHCVFMAEALNERTVDLQVGEYKYVTNPKGERIRVGYAPVYRENLGAQFFFTRDLTQRLKTQGVQLKVGPTEDVAVVVFNTELPLKADFQFTPLIEKSDLSKIITTLASYAPTVVTINPFEEISSSDTKRMASLNNISRSSGTLESRSTARVQEGDSGAPLFVRIGNSWRQVGVTKGRASTFFSNWDVFGILDQKICDIGGQINDSQIRESLCR